MYLGGGRYLHRFILVGLTKLFLNTGVSVYLKTFSVFVVKLYGI